MALAAVQTAMDLEQNKSVHPFFSKPHRTTPHEHKFAADEPPAETAHADADYEQPNDGAPAGKGRRKRARKPEGVKDRKEEGSGKSVQATIDGFARRATAEDAGKVVDGPHDSGRVQDSTLEQDPNRSRRKRRKTESPGPVVIGTSTNEASQAKGNLSWHQQLRVEAEKLNTEPMDTSPGAGLEAVFPTVLRAEGEPNHGTGFTSTTPTAHVSAEHTSPVEDVSQKMTPKKILKVNMNGKLVSPNSSKSRLEPTQSPKRGRGRPRKISKTKTLPTVTIIKYGSDLVSRRAIGKKIDDILDNRLVPKARPPTTNAHAKPTGPPKATHPFFTGKAASKNYEPQQKPVAETRSLASPKPPRKSAVTPGKLRAETRHHQSLRPEPAFGTIPGQTRDSKHLGIDEVPWPSKGMAHVRNLEDCNVLGQPQKTSTRPTHNPRKLKNQLITVSQDEDLINKLSQQLKPMMRGNTEMNVRDFPPPRDVRLPSRLLTTGVDIQQRVRREVLTSLSISERTGSGQNDVHPAIEALFKDIEQTLTPFDQGRCESQAWVQKYAPIRTSHVLQVGKEANVLQEWLQNLTVMAVRGSKDAPGSTSLEARRPPKKRRKKTEDDFIVSDEDEDDNELIELSGGEGYGVGSGLRRPKSLKRLRLTRHKNVIVLSGPHGCGKSATVYAVAKELGFEVFEINSGSRRSGKDVQDKVGDMSENHLVTQKRQVDKVVPENSSVDDPDNEFMSEALQKDLDSGRQGTMTSFFTLKPNTQAKPKVKAKPKAAEPRKVVSTQAILSKPQPARKSQKQSLILFEEADILYEEDQQFWAQVTKLASQSKRPIVITCNDEFRIPTEELPIAAVLRLSPPPVDLATDYLLVLAGREGHVLKRKAVCDLYKAKDHDLRASITELNLWCQMSVGDRKGGLEWFYQRWPPGKDVDANGELLRVASEGTYQSGMGWFSHNVSTSRDTIGFDKEHELSKEAWMNWDMSPDYWNSNKEKANDSGAQHQGSQAKQLKDLEQLDDMLESLSASDIYCRVGLPSYERDSDEPTDPSLPALTDKERLNYTQAAPVLQVDHLSDFTTFDTDMFVESHLSIRRAFGGSRALPLVPRSDADGLLPTREDDYVEAILQHKQDEQEQHSLSRLDFSNAFDILAVPQSTMPSLSTSYQLTPSSFDRTFRIVVEDLAPYVRSIVSHELVREAQRIRLSNLLSEGGHAKRPRTTRASRVAQEGGTRMSKRRERWFDKDLNMQAVMLTAGTTWAGLGSGVDDTDDTAMSTRTGDSLVGTPEE
ncbi:hypothetical protein BDV95DRAFT_354710 [Massariosphaeria phaeospora]|uniref:AAA+ ATPase domain-containing protein n=1 Tax=Massariosphaeria phaeospora TaxID=100035 RepID=A0A7C8IGS3_9PLEO|nr:hypothetical protein BDV95DRAFT_354710 [Massariosphaeria phaeospora]